MCAQKILIMQIINWVDQPAITENQRKIRYNDTVEKLKETKESVSLQQE